MTYLTRLADDEYRLFYEKPVHTYYVDEKGSYWTVEEYEKMIEQENNEQLYTQMIDNAPRCGWADVSENNLGLVVSRDAAEYLLHGEKLEENTFIKIELRNENT